MRLAAVAFALAVTAAPALAQSAAAPVFAPDTTIKVELQTKLDTKKAKVGDRIVAKLQQDVKSGDKQVLSKNDLLLGTITEVTPSQDKSPAKLGVLFTQATDKKGNILVAHFRGTIDKVFADSDNGGYSAFARGPEMGGAQPTLSTADTSQYANMDHSTNGVPIQYQTMATYDGQGTDLGGVISSVTGNFNLDQDTKVEVIVLQ